MNTQTPHVPSGDTHDDGPDLGRWELPPGRRSELKSELLSRIARDAATAGPAPAVGPRLVRPGIVLPAAALAVAAAVCAAVVTADHRPRPATAAPARADAAAVVWLDRAATVASRGTASPVRDDQFVHVRSLVRDNTGSFEGQVRLSPPHTREIWTSQDPDPVAELGTLRETGPGAVMPGQYVPIEVGRGTQGPGVERPTYAWLAGLPTDPDALLALLRDQVTPVDGESVDHAVFDVIGQLLNETIVPPPITAALYRVAATLPGVAISGAAVDAAGRPGIGITFEEGGSAVRNEWIFDRGSLAFLGDRAYFTGRNGRPDVLFHTGAVLERTVTDGVGRPATGKNALAG